MDADTENKRLREALTWALGFIQCNFPSAERTYPDYRNSRDLIAGKEIISGEFQLTAARAEVAEHRIGELEKSLEPFARITELPNCGPILDGYWMATWCDTDSFPTVGDVRRAKEVLNIT
jgi:hypothetical protein